MNATAVDPIGTSQKQDVIAHTAARIAEAETLFDVQLGGIDVVFNLRGRAAGMFRVRDGTAEIRYNPWLFSRFYTENLAETVPHEVAHFVVYRLFGRRRVKPHGNEWRKVMQAFGVEPRVTCNFDLRGIPVRQLRQFDYTCDCRSHALSSIRHNRVVAGKSRYHCRACGQPIQQA